MINLFHLQLFVEIVDQGSFTAAAKALNLSQPAVSQNIRALEESYKVKLFTRSGPHFELTEAGQRLLEAARPLIQQAQQVEESFNARLGEVHGRLNLAYSKNTAALYILPAMLAGFLAKHHGVRFSFTQTSEETALAMLLEKEVHFALLSSPPHQKAVESFMLQSAQLSLVLPPEHPWQDITVHLAGLRGQPFLLRSPGSQTRRMTEALLRSANLSLSDLQVVAEFDSSEGVILAVQAGLGVGFANSTIATRYAAHQQISLARLQLNESELTTGNDLCHEIYLSQLTTFASSEHPPSQKLFWDFLRSQQEFFSS